MFFVQILTLPEALLVVFDGFRFCVLLHDDDERRLFVDSGAGESEFTK